MSLHMSNMDIAASVVNSSCVLCGIGPPPNLILHIPPPPIPSYLQYGSNVYSNAGVLINPTNLNNSLCKHSCNWRTEGVQYVEMPHQGTVFDDTWLLVLISSCVGVIFIGLVLAALVFRCKFNGGMKNGSMSITAPPSGAESKGGRMQNEVVLYPCAVDNIQDSRMMWATLTPRGTTRHYLEEHTYETIGNGSTHKHNYTSAPIEHTYVQPSILQQVHQRPKDDKAFDNTAFIDYEEPILFDAGNCRVENDALDSSETELYGKRRCTLRPRVSSPTRIEHPDLPPLNLFPNKQGLRKTSGSYQQTSETLLKANNTLTAKVLLSNETQKTIAFQ